MAKITKKENKLVTKSIIMAIGSMFILSGFIGFEGINPLIKILIGIVIMFGGAYFFDLI